MLLVFCEKIFRFSILISLSFCYVFSFLFLIVCSSYSRIWKYYTIFVSNIECLRTGLIISKWKHILLKPFLLNAFHITQQQHLIYNQNKILLCHMEVRFCLWFTRNAFHFFPSADGLQNEIPSNSISRKKCTNIVE